MPSLEKLAEVTAKHEGSAGADSVAESPAGDPPPGLDSSAESALVDTVSPGDAEAGEPVDARATNARHAIMEEQLRELRERNRERAEKRKASSITKEAERDRQEAAAMRKQWETLGKEGSFLDAIKASGRDPRAVFEEMQREALQAGTPEAQIQATRKWAESFVAEQVTPLKSEIESLKAERDAEKKRAEEAEKAAAEHGFTGDFTSAINHDAFSNLREEYEDAQLLDIARGMRDEPERLFAQAARVGVDLTQRGGRFNMQDILQVLQATQDEHRAGIERRRAAKTAANPSTAAPTQAPAAATRTVNGTAERKAGSTLGNNLASERATEGRPRLTREQRVQELAKKYG